MEQQLTFFLALAAGLIFGGLAVWLILRSEAQAAYARAKSELQAEQAALTERVQAREARIVELFKECDQLKAEAEKLSQENSGLKTTQAELETRLAEGHKAAEEKLAVLNEARERLADAFKALSAEALHSNNEAFLDLAKATLESFQESARGDLEVRRKAVDELVTPLKDSLARMDSSLQEMEMARAAAFAGIGEQIRNMTGLQESLRAETANLVNALRTPAVRGRWGEIQLRRVVEMAGMLEYCDFEQQSSVETEDGHLRPDMIIKLPNQREVVVDAKVSLKAYLEAQETADEDARRARLKEHAAQVRAHLAQLGGKAYWNQFQAAPEFAVAFLPGETFFSAALQQDPALIEFGVEQRVILATPTTLIALLKAVAYGWRQEKLAQNAQAISNLGRSLYDRLLTFAGYFEEMRRHLQRTVDGYNRAAGSLESRVLVSARKFKELGVSTGADLPTLRVIDTVARSLHAAAEATAGEHAEVAFDNSRRP